MVSASSLLLGPLVGPECRRAMARGWLIVVRALAGAVLLAILVAAMWWWWINQRIDPYYRPYDTFRVALMMIEGAAVIIALVMTPALLAGSLAGERERGALGLLLTTRVNALEIVLGRLVGKLTQVATVLLAGVPAILFLTALAGFEIGPALAVLVLPFAVAFGGSGLGVAASAIARRGRNALLFVYVIEVVFLLSPLISFTSLPLEYFEWVGAINPFFSLGPLIWHEGMATPLVTLSVWVGFGVLGIAIAAWRLRPSCLGPSDRHAGLGRSWRPWIVQSVSDDRPMLWKELYIERASSLGVFGRWLGWGYVVGMGGGVLTLAVVYLVNLFYTGNDAWERWALDRMHQWVGYSGIYLVYLIVGAIGLRAAVGVSSERERGTWDAILTSPLSGGEVVFAKLFGCLSALRGLIGTTLFLWVIAAVCEAIWWEQAANWTASLFFMGTFLAALGSRISLEASTATRAMSLTIGLWLGSCVAVMATAGVIIAVLFMLWAVGGWVAAWLGWTLVGPPRLPPVSLALIWPLLNNALFAFLTFLVVSDTRLRFDRISGRMTEGRAAIKLERMIYGEPNSPVFLDSAGEAIAPVKESLDLLPGEAPKVDAVSETA